MIITIFFAIASISLIIFVPIYLKKKNNLYKYKPQEKMSLKKQKKTIKNIWEGVLSIRTFIEKYSFGFTV